MVKRNIYKEKSIKKDMNKRGEAVTIFAVVAFIVVAGSLAATSYLLTEGGKPVALEVSEDNYIGDIEIKIFYGYECLAKIKVEDRVFFNTYNQATKSGFSFSAKCPE